MALCWVYARPEFAGFVLMPARADALMLGALAAACVRSPEMFSKLVERRQMLSIGFGILLAGTLLISFYMPWSTSVHMNIWGHSWLALFYAAFLLIPLVNPNGLAAVALRNPLLQKLGILSYGVYLLHQPMLGLTYWLFHHGDFKASRLEHWGLTLLTLALTLGTATVLYRFLEKPMLRLGHSLKY